MILLKIHNMNKVMEKERNPRKREEMRRVLAETLKQLVTTS